MAFNRLVIKQINIPFQFGALRIV